MYSVYFSQTSLQLGHLDLVLIRIAQPLLRTASHGDAGNASPASTLVRASDPSLQSAVAELEVARGGVARGEVEEAILVLPLLSHLHRMRRQCLDKSV